MITEHTYTILVVTDYNSGTTVAILKDSAGHELGSGAAKLHPNDTFDYLTGKAIAVQRAALEFFAPGA